MRARQGAQILPAMAPSRPGSLSSSHRDQPTTMPTTARAPIQGAKRRAKTS